MKTAQSPDVQTLKRRLIEHTHSRQQRNSEGGNKFMNMTQPENAIKTQLDSGTNEESVNNRSIDVRKSQHKKNQSLNDTNSQTLHQQVKLKFG